MENKNMEQPTIVINNTQAMSNMSGYGHTVKDRDVSIVLAIFNIFGLAGLHKFYEGKPFIGIIYLITLGLCGIGTIIDILWLLAKPKKYIV